MIRKSTLLAVAASAVLGLAMLSPNVASARGHGGGHGGGHGMHGGGHGMHGGHGGRHFGHHRHHWHRHYVRWHRPIWYSPVVYGYGVRTATPGPCTCLSKEYTQEGAVLFKDRCTNEMAMNPPEQAPQQTGQLEQPQSAQYQAQYVQPRPQTTYPPQAN